MSEQRRLYEIRKQELLKLNKQEAPLTDEQYIYLQVLRVAVRNHERQITTFDEEMSRGDSELEEN